MQNQPHLQQSISSTGYYTANITQSLIAKAAPYIHIVNYYATIDPAIKTVLTAAEMHIVQADVTKYNAAPTAQKLPQSRSITPAQKAALFASQKTIQPYLWPWCTDVVRSNQVRWGWSCWINKCAVNDLTGEYGAAAIVIGLFTGPGGAVVALYVVNLQWASSQCHDGSVFMNDVILGLPVVWFAPGC